MLKRLIWVTALLFASTGVLSAQAVVQQPDCTMAVRAGTAGGGIALLTAVGTSALFDNRGSGCTDWTLTYNTFGFTAATLQVVDAPNNNGTPGTPVAFAGTIVGGGTQPVTASISGGFSSGIISVSGYYPYMGVALVSKTGTGSLQGTLYGWRRAAITANAGTVVVIPSSSSGNAVSESQSVAYETSRIAKASAGNFYGVFGYNSKASAQFIQCYNSATLPADTAVPIVTFTVAATSNFSLGLGNLPINFSTGIVCANSSTGPTKTIGSADTWFNVLYQ